MSLNDWSSYYDSNYGKDWLIGLRVDKIELSDDATEALLHGVKSEKPIVLSLVVEGDCCSTSWIESVIEESSIVGHTILSWEDLELNDQPANGKTCVRCGASHEITRDENYAKDEPDYDLSFHDSLSFYGLALNTEAGRCVIDFRNDSNGYYGGSITVKDRTAQLQPQGT